MIHKSFKYRLYPTRDQARELDRNFGAVRCVWNALVANFNSYGTPDYKEKVNLKELFPWLLECSSFAISQKYRDFQQFKDQYFNKKRKKKLGRPNFKKKGIARDSFRIPGQKLTLRNHIDFKNGKIKCSKLGWIKCIFHREFTDKILLAVFSKTKTGEYYVSVTVECERPASLPKINKSVGLDLGLKDLAILSDGTKFQNAKYFAETQGKLKKAQQHLSRKIKGSNRYNQQRLKVARIHEKIKRQREWYYHNISRYLVETYDVICVESLNVAGMKRRNGKSISDAAWITLFGMIFYKADWYGKDILQVSRWFPSSQLCFDCGFKNSSLTLEDREWSCPDCGSVHNRDVNAARNILKECVPVNTSEELPENRHGETIRPDWFLVNHRARFEEVSRNICLHDLEVSI